MKHSLIILISFFLLSSPVIGDNHKGETLYRWENPSGDGYVWKKSGEKETHPIYQGQVKDGKPDGLGIMIDNFGGRYVGEWKNGKRNGQGTSTTSSIGYKYVGEWKNGKHWNGTRYYKGGKIIYKYVNGKGVKQ
jgi:hypothetical protein